MCDDGRHARDLATHKFPVANVLSEVAALFDYRLDRRPGDNRDGIAEDDEEASAVLHSG